MHSILCVILLLCSSIWAITESQYKEKMTRHIMSCTKQHPVEMSDLFKLEKYVIPTKREVKCLLACAYRKEGLLTDKGLLDKQATNKTAYDLGDGDDTRLKNALKMLELCDKVNAMPVTDNEKGCDRATLAFKCIGENASKYGFKLV